MRMPPPRVGMLLTHGLSWGLFGQSSGHPGSRLLALHPAGRGGKSLEHLCVSEVAQHSFPFQRKALGMQEWIRLDTQQPLPVAMRQKKLMHVKRVELSLAQS